MKTATTFALIVCAIAALPIVNPPQTADWGTPWELAAALAFWPALAVSVFGIIAGLVSIFGGFESRQLGLIWLALGFVLPICAATKRTISEPAFDAKYSWFDQTSGAGSINSLIFEFLLERPNAVRYIGDSEEVEIDGLVELIRRHSPIYYRDQNGRKRQLEIDGSTIRTPWGAAVRFAVDRNHDGYITAGGQKASTRYGTTDPWAYDPNYKYTKACGVFVSLPDRFLRGCRSSFVTLDDNEYHRIKFNQ